MSRKDDAGTIEHVVLCVEIPHDDGILPIVIVATFRVGRGTVFGEEDSIIDANLGVRAFVDGKISRERRAVAPPIARPRTARRALVGLRIKPGPGVPFPGRGDSVLMRVGTGDEPRCPGRIAGPVPTLRAEMPKAADVLETTSSVQRKGSLQTHTVEPTLLWFCHGCS